MTAEQWREEAARRDAADPLSGWRGHFYLPEGLVYLDGNSLGLLSREAEAAVLGELARWRELGVAGWSTGDPSWFHLSERLGEISAEIVGAEPDEVAVTGSLTANLHQMLATLYRPESGRAVILIDRDSFPTDHYAVESHLRLRGLDPAQTLRTVAARGDLLEEEEIERALQPDVALALLPGVLYRTGQLLDIARLTRRAQAAGALVGWDLAHAAGAVPLCLHEWDVDFAVWCNYKYLSGGPGAVGSLFLHRRHLGAPAGLWGWFGSDKAQQFDMRTAFTPARGAGALQTGTPHILSAAALLGSLRLVRDVGLAAIRARSLAQTEFLLAMADDLLPAHGFSVATPREAGRRGGHVALRHARAPQIARALRARGVIPDFRPPDIVRLGPNPLYTSCAEIARAMLCLREIMDEGAHLRESAGRDEIA